MKILLISDFFPQGKDLKFSGGVEARTFFLAKNLARKHKVTVICSRQPGTKPQEVMFGLNVTRVGPVVSYNSGAPSLFDTHKRAAFMLKAIHTATKLDIDIVDGGNFIDHFIAKRVGNANNIPVVYWYPDVFLRNWVKTSGLLGGFVGYLLEKYNLSQSIEKYIAISNTTKNKLVKVGIRKDNIVTIPCGVEIGEFKEKIKKTEYFQIICISRLVVYKRVKDLILAFALISQDINYLRLVIIGSGPQKKGLIKLINELHIANKVKFLENLPRKELIKNIQESKLFVLPSSVEGFGISTIEAAAAGIPYVVSNIPVLREVTLNGKGGLLFKVGNIYDLTRKMRKIIQDEKLYGQKSKEAKKLAQKYDWVKIAKDTENLYKKIIK